MRLRCIGQDSVTEPSPLLNKSSTSSLVARRTKVQAWLQWSLDEGQRLPGTGRVNPVLPICIPPPPGSQRASLANDANSQFSSEHVPLRDSPFTELRGGFPEVKAATRLLGTSVLSTG